MHQLVQILIGACYLLSHLRIMVLTVKHTRRIMETELEQLSQGNSNSNISQPEDDSLSGDEMFMTTMDEPVSHDAMDGDHTHQADDIVTTMDDGSGMEYMATVGQPESLSELSDAQVAGLAAFATVWAAISLVIFAVSVVALWRIFSKAGQAGWKSLVPLYNAYVLLQIVGRPGWWLLLLFIPLVNIVIALLVSLDLAKVFGRSQIFGVVALFLFSLVGYCILAFSGDKYLGPDQSSQPAEPTPDPDSSPDTAAPAV